MDLFDCNVSGKVAMLSFECCLLCMHFVGLYALTILQALAIVAFNGGKLNLNTFKTMLSIGPTFAVMNFLESKPLAFILSLLP